MPLWKVIDIIGKLLLVLLIILFFSSCSVMMVAGMQVHRCIKCVSYYIDPPDCWITTQEINEVLDKKPTTVQELYDYLDKTYHDKSTLADIKKYSREYKYHKKISKQDINWYSEANKNEVKYVTIEKVYTPWEAACATVSWTVENPSKIYCFLIDEKGNILGWVVEDYD